MKICEIIKDEDIYPRQNVSQKTIEAYVESLKAGAKFPSIEVQKISVKKENGSTETKIICLDGWHRLESYREFNNLKDVEPITEVEVTFWKDEILDKNENFVELLIRSAKLNMIHGLRLSQEDAKNQLIKIANTSNALNIVWKDIADGFGVTPEWASKCVSSILATKRMSRNAFIYKLTLLGYTYDEIEAISETSRPTIAEAVKKLNEFKNLTKTDFYDNHKPIEEICEYYKLDEPLTWAILLEGKSDEERLELLSIKNKDYDVWTFSERDPRLGLEAKGNIPGQIAINVLLRYTKQGDLVVDPMAGGGSTIDACLVMGRKCRAYDINPHPERKDVIKNGIENGIPIDKECDLLFLDPPYYNKVSEISNFKNPENFNSFLEHIAEISLEKTKPKGHVALVLSDYLDYDIAENSLFTFRTATMFESKGLRTVGHFWCPLSTQQYSGSDVIYAREHNRDLEILRECFVFKRG